MAAVLRALDFGDVFRDAPPIKWPRRKADPMGIIYFIGPSQGMVKIGYTTNLETRLKRLQCGSPVPLRVIASVEGPRSLEREYHARFKRAREHGEWFLRTIDVEAEIARLNEE